MDRACLAEARSRTERYLAFVCTKLGQVTWICKIVDQVTWETKCEDQITSTTILQKWTRPPTHDGGAKDAASAIAWRRRTCRTGPDS